MKTTENNSTQVIVIGLGNMGTAIALLLLNSGYKVAVWNRTASKAEPLVSQGAVFATDIQEGIRTSSVVIICVYDYSATRSIFDNHALTDVLKGKVLIQLTTGSPKEARELGKTVHQFGAEYLDGAIQVAPEQMGKSDTTILFSGSKDAFGTIDTILKTLGGNLVYLGEDAGTASAMDLATLSSIYGTLFGFFHGAAISESEGLDVARYAAIVADILPSFGEFLKHEASVIQSGNFETSQSPLSISVAATERLLQTAKEAGINTDFPMYASGVLKKAENAGYADEELAAVYKTLRRDIFRPAASV